ncbi:MAG: response regulator transcription factor [Candidatus Sericytochromatia bacterium]|nr:response regulator transcription factor [Candidatus Sericytochromatia bacterium]
MARILIVEDEDHIAQGLRYNLVAEGHEVLLAGDGETADRLIREGDLPDLVVLDVMLPGLSGIDLCRGWRTLGIRTPILMLTARGFDKAKVEGLQVGADDYVTKPFNLEELLARVDSLLRREAWRREEASPVRGVQRIGCCEIDFERGEAWREGEPVRLTSLEFRMLRHLAEAGGRIVSRDELMAAVWGFPSAGATRTVDNFVMRLRRLIEPDPARPVHLLSLRGQGLRLEPGPPGIG